MTVRIAERAFEDAIECGLRSPEPVFLKWKGIEASADGGLHVRRGPGTAHPSGPSPAMPGA